MATCGSAVLLGAGLWTWGGFSGAKASGDLITQPAIKGTFVHDVTERGELESSNNISVRCEVSSRGTGSNGVKIIEIVPEGTVVKKGDFLVKFDAAALETERTTQQINVSSAEAAAAQSTNDLESAAINRKEYEFGEFESEKEKINGEILIATEMRIRAIDTVKFCEKQVRTGYMSRSDLRSSEYDLAKYTSDLKIAQTKMMALTEWTKQKKIKELDAKIKTCEAKLKSDEAKLALERQKLHVLDDQIAKCHVVAPAAGQVIYDHEQDHWRGAEYQIKQGTVIHEQRVVIRLPDPKQMQVIAKVAESRIDLIKVGMPATIEIEGLPGTKLNGKVTKVNEYPASENWFNDNVKEYATTVEVSNPTDGLRPGMTAKVAIRVETLTDALQVPIQAVVERSHSGKHYCLVVHGGSRLDAREVLVGSTNEKFIVIRDGLTPSDQVVMNPRVHLAILGDEAPAADPKIALQEPAKKSKSTARDERPAAASGGPGS
ncbi:MAG TPA: efflux RND transporter periplasmic adaptor subunit [Pirellulales bacterium]|nr:efflux RND transporter periplasmic adaptor subunit [Pirellulales bacterium]